MPCRVVTVTRAPRAGESAGEPTARRRETERAAKATTGEKRKRNADSETNARVGAPPPPPPSGVAHAQTRRATPPHGRPLPLVQVGFE